MKRFINKGLVFGIYLLVFTAINLLVNHFLASTQSVPVKKAAVLILGDSHPETGINPKYFGSAANIAQSAEPYVLSYWKLKKILQEHRPDTLIVGFAPHNISEFNDYKFSDANWSTELFKRSYPIQEFDRISDQVEIDFPTYYKTLWKETALYPKRDHVNYIGRFSYRSRSDVSNWERAINRHYYRNSEQLSVSSLATAYLDSIVQLGQTNNMVVVLASHPVYKKYLDQIPADIMKSFEQLSKKYEKDHIVFNRTGVHYPDSLFMNSDHLNGLGADRFTQELIEHMDGLQP